MSLLLWLIGGAGTGLGMWLFFKKKPMSLDYPHDFAIITFSRTALESNIRDNQNKIINRYFYNQHGNLENATERYSEERVSALREIHKIPILDKTQEETIFPVFGRILPSEIVFKSK